MRNAGRWPESSPLGTILRGKRRDAFSPANTPRPRNPRLQLLPLSERDVPATVKLVSRAMNDMTGQCAARTLKFHFRCNAAGIDDGRRYFTLASPSGGSPIGLVGLHHAPWSPPENVWLAWFAVDPREQGKGYGHYMMTEMLSRSRAMGFKKMMIETYASHEFFRARAFYRRHGFIKAGSVVSYQPDGSSMLVYLKRL